MATKVEELLQEISDVLEDTANSLDPSRHRDFIGLDDVLEQLISAARKEGAQRERRRVVSEAHLLRHGYDAREAECFYGERQDNGDIDVLASYDLFIVPASVFAHDKESEK